MERDLHVVGRGAVSCFGVGVDRLFEGVFGGSCGLRPRRRLADCECTAAVAAEVPDEVWQGVDPAELPLQVAARAAREALGEAAHDRRDPVALVLATTKADLSGVAFGAPANRPPGLGVPARLVERLQRALELDGPTAAVSCACASGLAALAVAGRALRTGGATTALVVGVDVLDPFILRGFDGLLALDPRACRPFDAGRGGLSLGEGAGAVVVGLEPRSHPRWRVLGWGESNDANHITGPSRDGSGLARAATLALQRAEVDAGEIDLVHLHGTGTPYNDAMEGRAMRSVFGDRAVAGAGSKGQIGHTLGAAGLLEALIAGEALDRGVCPPNVGLERLDDTMSLRLAPAPTELSRSRTAVKVSAGFGGINAAVVLAHG